MLTDKQTVVSTPPKRSTIADLMLLALLVLVGAILAALCGWFVATFMPAQGTTPWGLRISQILATLCVLGFPVVMWRLLHREPIFCHFSQPPFGAGLTLLALSTVVAVQPFVGLLTYLNSLIPLPEAAINLERRTAVLIEQMLCISDGWAFFVNILAVALVPAVCEEMFFRGLLQSFFMPRLKHDHLTVWLVALLFAIVHFQFEGVLARIFLGALLGYLYLYTRSLWIPIGVHFLNNAAAVVLYFIYFQVNGTPPPTDADFPLHVLLTLLVAAPFLFWVFKKLVATRQHHY